MLRKGAFGVIGLAAIAAGLLLLGSRATTAAPKGGETSGQLTIVDKKGKAVGVCPLKHTTVTADVAGYVSRVTVEQEFANTAATAIEAVYTFPLPGDAAVDDMTMLIGRRVVRGRILRSEDARQVYEEAKAQGKATALLDQERPNIFTQSVANIPPGETVKITIRYTNLLKYHEGVYEFVYPMVVGPRYVGNPDAAASPHQPYQKPAQVEKDPQILNDVHKITPPITPEGTRAGHDISITVNLDAGITLTDVGSPSHKIDTRQVAPHAAVIKLRDAATIPNKDFILRYTAAGSDVQSGILTFAPKPGQDAPGAGKKGGYFTLILQPPTSPAQSQITPKEMVFVIDQTGSQNGKPIAKAKETMRYCIQHLNPGDTFQLIGFNTDVYPCFDAPVPANEETIAKALKFMEPLEGRGGTDILKSVTYALKMPDDPDRLRIICYMTDGYVGNDMQILDYIGKNRGRARMFPFGVGSSPNRFLIDGMAREGKGAAEYVSLDEDGQKAAERFYRRVANPLLRDIELDFGDLPVEEVYPKYIPDVFTAGPIVVKGRYTGVAQGKVTVHGLLRGQPWSQTVDVNLPAVDTQHPSLATLWAREKIEDLQNKDWIGAQMGSPDQSIKEQIIGVALTYRLMSQYTSFVAVEERVVNVGGNPKRVDVPVEMPEGVSYEGIFGGRLEAEGVMKSRAFGRPMAVGLRVSGVTAAGTVAASPAMAGSGGFGGGGGASSMSTMAGAKREAADKLSLSDAESKAAADPMQKLSADLRATVKAAGTDARKLAARVDVQITLGKLPKDGLAKLKTLGFTLTAELRPSKLLLGSASVGKLKALAALDYVVGIRPLTLK